MPQQRRDDYGDSLDETFNKKKKKKLKKNKKKPSEYIYDMRTNYIICNSGYKIMKSIKNQIEKNGKKKNLIKKRYSKLLLYYGAYALELILMFVIKRFEWCVYNVYVCLRIKKDFGKKLRFWSFNS